MFVFLHFTERTA